MKLTYDSSGGVLRIFLHGEMDHHSAKEARERTDALIENERPAALLIDASGITFCDSSGLGYIMGRFKKMKETGGETRVIHPSRPVARMLALSGMDRLVKVEVCEK